LQHALQVRRWREESERLYSRMQEEKQNLFTQGISTAMSKEIIRLSCGGELVVITAPLLRRAPPRLQQLLQQTPDMNGLVPIDRDRIYFAPLIHYLRTGHITIDPGVSPHGVAAEAA
jgi:hypothetical protein